MDESVDVNEESSAGEEDEADGQGRGQDRSV